MGTSSGTLVGGIDGSSVWGRVTQALGTTANVCLGARPEARSLSISVRGSPNRGN